jgi:uncharacterized Ntn-hydrolase superfamily protein
MIPEKTALLGIGLDAVQWVITAAVGVWVYLLGRDQVRRQSLQAMENRIEGRLDQIDQRLAADRAGREHTPTQRDCAVQIARIATLEAQQRQAPSHEDIKRVHVRIDAATEAIAEMRGSVRRIEHTTDMISQYLMDHPHSGGQA